MTTNENTDTLPKSLRIRTKYNFTDSVESTDQSMPSDFFIGLMEIPGDILVPGPVFFAVRDVNEEILHIGQTIGGPPAVTGVIDRDRLASPVQKTIDDIASLPRTVDVHRTADESLTELEVVYEQSRRAKTVGSTLARTLDASNHEILNVQNHGHRSGVSIYLRNPDTPSDCDIEGEKTLVDLLTR